MGILRLLLALSVVATHCGAIWKFGMVGGQVAVQSFFIISGFYMSLILNEKYVGVNKSYKLFLTNRLLRLYPIYWVVLLMTIGFSIALVLTGRNVFTLTGYASVHPNIFSFIFLVLSNVLIFGQDMVMFLGINAQNGRLFFTSNFINTSPALYNFLFIPQAWTLGLELMFYIVAPFILKRGTAIVVSIILFSVLLRFFIYHYLGFTNDPWTYRFFPTELGFFLLGNVSYRIYCKIKSLIIDKHLFLLVFLGIISATIVFPFLPSLKFDVLPFSMREIIYFIGITLSIPLLFIFFKKNKLDGQIGELSYPVYISHMFVYFLCVSLHNKFMMQGWFIALITVIVSWLLNHFVAKPIERFRQSRVAGVRAAYIL